MTNRTRSITALALSLAIAAAIPVGAEAAVAPSCTDQFESCLNDTWDTEGIMRGLADDACLVLWTACVAKKIFG